MLPFGEYKDRNFHNLTFEQGDLDYEAASAHMNGTSNFYEVQNCTFTNCSFENVDFALYFKTKGSLIQFVNCKFKNCWYSTLISEDCNENGSLAMSLCEIDGLNLIAASFESITLTGCNISDTIINDCSVNSKCEIEGSTIIETLINNLYVGGYGMKMRGNQISDSLINNINVQSGPFETIANNFFESTIDIPNLTQSDSYNSNSFEDCDILDENHR